MEQPEADFRANRISKTVFFLEELTSLLVYFHKLAVSSLDLG